MALADTPSLPRRTLVQLAVAACCVTVLAYEVHGVDLQGLFAHVRPWWLLAAVAAFVVSLGAAAHNISSFAPIRLRAVDTVRAQLAVCGLRIVAPSAVSTPAIGIRFLHRKGLSLPTATAVLALAQTVQLLATIAVVAVLAATASTAVPTPSTTVLIVIGVAVGAVIGVLRLVRRLPWIRARLGDLVAALRTVARTLRAQPARVLSGFAAAALLTAAHVAAFVCCAHAVGATTGVLALTIVYLGASSAGSLVPTPGGIGAVESALIAGLVATGQSVQVATAAAVVSRVLTVWAPAVPGLLAMRSLRRSGAL